MALHKDLTGAELHEPKGVASAASGTVYVADGSGSGDWTPVYDGVYNLNEYWMDGTITDISTVSDKCYIYVPVDSEIFEIAAIINTALTTADAVLSVYINGVLFADTLTVTQAGSFAGQLHHTDTTTSNTVPAGSVLEIRSNGASDTTSKTNVWVGLRAIA